MLGKEEMEDMQTWNQILKEVDQNGDGVIDLKEFEQLLNSKF
jgi:Ca2+-binding EF-hand superfamily protein